MPYRRNRYRRRSGLKRYGQARSRRTFRRRRRVPSGYGTYAMMKGHGGFGSMKHLDQAFTAAQISTTYNSYFLAGIAQGTGHNKRIHNKIHIRSIRWRFTVTPGIEHILSTSFWALIVDKMPDGTAPTQAEIWEVTDPNSFQKKGNAGRFRVLRQKHFVMQGDGNDNAKQSAISIRQYHGSIKFKNFVQLWDEDAATGGIADCRQNAIFFVLYGNGVVAADTQILLDGYIRINFVDG